MSAKKKPAKRQSGPSGINRQPRYTLRATYEEFNAWQREADKADLHLNQWIRDQCNTARKR